MPLDQRIALGMRRSELIDLLLFAGLLAGAAMTVVFGAVLVRGQFLPSHGLIAAMFVVNLLTLSRIFWQPANPMVQLVSKACCQFAAVLALFAAVMGVALVAETVTQGLPISPITVLFATMLLALWCGACAILASRDGAIARIPRGGMRSGSAG